MVFGRTIVPGFSRVSTKPISVNVLKKADIGQASLYRLLLILSTAKNQEGIKKNLKLFQLDRAKEYYYSLVILGLRLIQRYIYEVLQ